MDQIALGLIKMQLGKEVEELSEKNFDLDLGRGGGHGDRSRSGRDRDRGGRGRERSERGRDRGQREKGKREPNMARLFLNLGKKDQIRPNDIVGAIAGETGVPGRSIGGIDIFDNFSFVDVPTKDASHVMDVMNTNTIKGKSVNIELSKS
jgi:ATP-dependent RNA helicase DeaD